MGVKAYRLAGEGGDRYVLVLDVKPSPEQLAGLEGKVGSGELAGVCSEAELLDALNVADAAPPIPHDGM